MSKGRRGGNTYFTADPHFGHKLVSGLRGFNDTESHDNAIMDNWENTVGPNDTVYVLGDLALGFWKEAIGLITELPGYKHLIVGNHDMCFPGHRQSYKYQRRYFLAFESVQSFARLKIAGRYVFLSHFPYVTDGTDMEPRHMQYRLPDLGHFLLHGHTHSNKKVTSDHEIHVGLDAWDLKPVSIQKIELLIHQVEQRDQSPQEPLIEVEDMGGVRAVR
jgi:calcineurin-like phosphoesterase family protein